MNQRIQFTTTGRHTSCLVSAVALLLGGCASDDNGPLAPHLPILDPAVVVTPALTPTPQPAPTKRKPETVTVITVTGDITSSRLITARHGGVVTAGRHRLTVPPGALKSDTIIELKDVSGSAGFVSCEAYPEGLEFLKPALLESRFRDIKDPAGFTIYWIANPNKSDEQWIDMRASPSADAMGLAIELHHFSTYAPGKAGWAPRRGGQGLYRSDR